MMEAYAGKKRYGGGGKQKDRELEKREEEMHYGMEGWKVLN